MLIRTSHLQQLPPQITLLKIALHATQFLRQRHPPQVTPTGLVFWRGSVKMQSVLTLPDVHYH